MNTPSSLHPVRWTLTLLIGVPALLVVICFVAWMTRQHEAARAGLRLFRYVIAAECAFLLIAAVWGAIYEYRSARRDRATYQPAGRLIDIGGYRLHLHCSGAGGQTVVLEHGLSGSYLDWRKVQPEAAQFTRVCSYDRAGYGWSDPSPRARVPSIMAEELRTLLKNAGENPPFILVGHSMAAFDVITFAHRYPDEVSGLVLVDGSHPDERLRFSWRAKVWLRIVQLTLPFGLPRWRHWCASGAEEIRGFKAAMQCRGRVFRTEYQERSGFAGAAAEVRKLGTLGELPLIVISRDPQRAEDRSSSRAEQHWAELQRDLARLSSNATHVVASGSGHGISLQRPEVVVDAIRKLARETAANASGSR